MISSELLYQLVAPHTIIPPVALQYIGFQNSGPWHSPYSVSIVRMIDHKPDFIGEHHILQWIISPIDRV